MTTKEIIEKLRVVGEKLEFEVFEEVEARDSPGDNRVAEGEEISLHAAYGDFD